MVPKAGDLVRLNPEGSGHPMMASLKEFLGTLSWIVDKVTPQPAQPGYVSVRFKGTDRSVGIWVEDGRFYASAPGTPCLFLSVSSAGSEPRNNDGRQECFWCAGIKTQKRGGGLYDVCPKCGK